MSDETKLHPWVDSEIDKSGDLHLTSGVRGLGNMVTKRVMTMEQKAINDWLKDQGWSTPEEKTELIEALEKCVWLLSSLGHAPENSTTAMVAFDAIVKAKGEQG